MPKAAYFEYFAKVNSKVKLALTLAKENINSEWVPINILEKTCKDNVNNKLSPVYTQYLWFCLNRNLVRRYYPSGRVQQSRVSFAPVYVEPSKKIVGTIKKAVILCPKPKMKTFSYLSDRTYTSIWEYLRSKCYIPLTVILKASNVIGLDPWKLLNGSRLYSRNKKSYLTYRSDYGFDINTIVEWIKLEGTIPLSSPRITISQLAGGEDALIKLKETITKIFNSEISPHLDRSKTRPGMCILDISSAPLRQIVALRYGIQLGYKSRKIKPQLLDLKNLSKEQIVKMLASCFETEGSFIHRKQTIYHVGYCEFVFSSYSKEYAENIKKRLEFLRFSPSFEEYERKRKTSENEYRVSIRKYNELVRLCYGILPYLRHKDKIIDILAGFLEENYILRCRISNSQIVNLFRKTKQKVGTYKKLSEYIRSRTGIKRDIDSIRSWCIGNYKTPLIIIWEICKLLNENWKKCIPKYFSLLLWLNGLISREEMENTRGLAKDSLMHVENIKRQH